MTSILPENRAVQEQSQEELDDCVTLLIGCCGQAMFTHALQHGANRFYHYVPTKDFSLLGFSLELDCFTYKPTPRRSDEFVPKVLLAPCPVNNDVTCPAAGTDLWSERIYRATQFQGSNQFTKVSILSPPSYFQMKLAFTDVRPTSTIIDTVYIASASFTWEPVTGWRVFDVFEGTKDQVVPVL